MLNILSVKALLTLLTLPALTCSQGVSVKAAKAVTCGDYRTLDVGSSHEVDNNGSWPCQISFNVNSRLVTAAVISDITRISTFNV